MHCNSCNTTENVRTYVKRDPVTDAYIGITNLCDSCAEVEEELGDVTLAIES